MSAGILCARDQLAGKKPSPASLDSWIPGQWVSCQLALNAGGLAASLLPRGMQATTVSGDQLVNVF